MGFFDPQSNKFVRDDAAVALKLPVSYVTADAAVLFTVPEGVRLHIERTFWEVTTAFTGGTNSAIGASASVTYTTKGDLQGGASGDLLAALTAGFRPGTVGAAYGTNGIVVLSAGTTIRFDRIASVFTAGAGYLHVLGRHIRIGA